MIYLKSRKATQKIKRGVTVMLNMNDVKRIHESKGLYFFSKDTIKFFHSRIGDTLYGDKYFVSSERMDNTVPRRYTVREFDAETGYINTVGDFGGFNTKTQAVKYIKGLLEKVAKIS